MEKLPEMAAFFVEPPRREVYPERSRREPKRGSKEVEKLPEMAAFFVELPVLVPTTGHFGKQDL